MNILYIGDIYGEPGIETVEKVLPGLRREKKIDLVIAQGENVSDGRGLLPKDMRRLQDLGVDAFTGGNWTLFHNETQALLSDPGIPVTRPANYPEGTPGLAYKFVHTAMGSVLIVSLLGHIVGKDADKEMDNPLKIIDEILTQTKSAPKIATIVNLHGDYSSEKLVIGFYLDGRATAVVGDHWHVPTADARIFPKGTAHITDVGMCGTLHSSLGVETEIIIERWRDGKVNRNEVATGEPLQFNAVLIEADEKTGLAKSIEQVQRVLN